MMDGNFKLDLTKEEIYMISGIIGEYISRKEEDIEIGVSDSTWKRYTEQIKNAKSLDNKVCALLVETFKK